MRKLLNKDIKRLLNKYYKTLGNDAITERRRNRRLKLIKIEIDKFSKVELVNTACELSKSRKKSFLFKTWCEFIVYTGEV